MKLIIAFLATLIMLIGCSSEAQKPSETSPGARDAAQALAPLEDGVLFVSILPQKYFLDRVSGGRWQVEVMVPPGASPATYNPTPQQIMRLSKARAYFRIGVPFEEAFLPNVTKQLPELEIVDTRQGITLRSINDVEEHEHEAEHDEHEHEMEQHDHEMEHHDHEHHGDDPHIWLSPTLAHRQARTMSDWLAQHDPNNKAAYEQNLADFGDAVEQLRKEIFATLEPLQNRTLLVFHPSWGYFCDEFGLHQVAIETGGKSPTVSPLAQVIDFAKEHDIRVVFVQRQFSTVEAQAVADAIGGRVVSVDPLSEDWLRNLRQIAQTVASEEAAQ